MTVRVNMLSNNTFWFIDWKKQTNKQKKTTTKNNNKCNLWSKIMRAERLFSSTTCPRWEQCRAWCFVWIRWAVDAL